MKAGDLVQDSYGNIGIVINTAVFGNGIAAQVNFDPAYNSLRESWRKTATF